MTRRLALRAGIGLTAVVIVSATVSFLAAATDSEPAASPRPPSGPAAIRATSTTSSSTTTVLVPSSEGLAAALGEVWRRTPVGCAVAALGDQLLFEANTDAAVIPASVAKLLTAVAALDVLGAGTRLSTSVRGDLGGDGVVRGDLWLTGGGDPVLGTHGWANQAHRDGDGQWHTSLDTLADRVVAAGVRRVTGRVVGDESRYDGQRIVESWPRRFITDGEIGPLSALTVNDGFRVWGHPGVPFSDPAAGAAGLFRELLVRRGVVVEGDAASGTAPAGPDLATIESPAIGDLIAQLLRESDNGTAELLVKEMGLRRYQEGSTAAGVRAVTDALEARMAPLAGTVVADGSGLSSDARVTCRLLAFVLSSAQPLLADRLAVAGHTGTLQRRLRGTPAAGRVRAKTGSFDGVSALAGYADTPAGRRLVFAYVANSVPAPTRASAVQDPFALALVTSGL